MFYTAKSLPTASASSLKEECQHGCPLCLHWFLNESILHFIQFILRHICISVSPFMICQQRCYREGNVLSDQAQNIWKSEIRQSLAMKQAPKEQNWPSPQYDKSKQNMENDNSFLPSNKFSLNLFIERLKPPVTRKGRKLQDTHQWELLKEMYYWE